MVLCASNDDHTKVELLNIPNDSKIGERITFHGCDGEPAAPNFMVNHFSIYKILHFIIKCFLFQSFLE